MTTRYRVEYALKSHRRDQLIEWIKGLLAVPFVLHSQPTAVFEPGKGSTEQMAAVAQRRYLEIIRDVEELINDHIRHQQAGTQDMSKLKLLVPSVGVFFTPLSLSDAFVHQDARRFISWRRFVAPSFNDVRLILNTAQVMSLVKQGPLDLVTFDGDVTLYDDGGSLERDSPLVPRLLALLARGTRVAIVTAAGYTEASKYYQRLHGLLDAIAASDLDSAMRDHLVVLGGESNYMYRYSEGDPHRLQEVPHAEWMLDEMRAWKQDDISQLLDLSEIALKECIKNFRLSAQVVRKDRAVGFIPTSHAHRFPREALEETVLTTQRMLEVSPVGQRIPFCAFNGGNDIFVDVGDKNYGVRACQRYFRSVQAGRTLHVGDQFLSAGANDFKARRACTTAWVASPAETVELLDEIEEHGRMMDRKKR